MRKKILLLAAMLPLFFAFVPVPDSDTKAVATEEPAKVSPLANLKERYNNLGIQDVICFEAFNKAYEGFYKIPQVHRQILTVIDFTKPSNQPRLAVVDLESNKVLYTSLVAHGRNSGDMYAKSFSNVEGSYQSSLGFYLTGGTYNGGNGYSLRLIGLEKGFNDKALERAIVIHGASYCNPSIVAGGNRLGRSWGCPALPQSVTKPIINAIKDGSVLFIYAQDKNYLAQSPIVGSHHGDPQA